MKIKFWPFPLFRNYSTSQELTQLFFALAAQDDLSVSKPDFYTLKVSTGIGTVEFWDANKYYAWADRGTLTTTGGRTVSWQDEMPSRAAARAMRKAISGKLYEIADRSKFKILDAA